MSYIPHTKEDIQEMLTAIGKSSVEELFQDIPEKVRIKGEYNIPAGLSEPELIKHVEKIASTNKTLEDHPSFLGAGAYEHFIPVLVDYITGRSEFWTAYTPYQPETSQGNLQAIFEYQTAICELTGMDVSNASMYDGPTALAEALLLSCAHHREKRRTFLLPASLHPEYREVVATYLQNLENISLVTIPEKNGLMDMEKLTSLINDTVAAVVVQSPNFYGLIEDLEAVVPIAHNAGALVVSVVNPISLGLLNSPGYYNADIAVGDGQPLGIPVSYGGPAFGFMACKKEHVRKMPGRIVGQTNDARGDRGFVLTLQTREQHIRREKATSNICSNEALMAFRGLLYLISLGKEGFYEVATQCAQKAHYLASCVSRLPGYSLRYPSSPFYHEFVVRCPRPADTVIKQAQRKNIYCGVSLGRWYPDRSNELLIATTECRTKKEISALLAAMTEL